MSFCCLHFTVRFCFCNSVCSQTPGGPGTRGTDSWLHDTESQKFRSWFAFKSFNV